MLKRRDVLVIPLLGAATLAMGGRVLAADAASAGAKRQLADDLAEPEFERRAIEAVIWSMPAVNLELMSQAMLKSTPARMNQILYWSKLLDWKCQTLTPNSDVIYLKPFWDMTDVGPMVVEIPPADDGVINGTLMDGWQTPFEDVGPAGLDGGKGGRYLILPPAYSGAVPDGYHVFRSQTYGGYGLLRSILRGGSPADIDKAVNYGRRIRLFPLSQAANPPATAYTDANGVLFDSTIPYNATYFVHLDRFVQREPWIERDRAMIDTLRTIGIQKGKPFTPTARHLQLLDSAAAKAFALLDARFERLFDTPFAPGSNWSFVASAEYAEQALPGWPNTDIYMVDERGLVFSYVFFAPRRLGDGQFWTMSHKDSAGSPLIGSASYRLRVPPNAPVTQFWSITLYDRLTHAFVRNVPTTSRSSQSPGLRSNQDGSVDVFLGPEAPPGFTANWVPTDPTRSFEAMARFYGPLPPLFNHSWVLPSIERIG